MKSNRTLFGLAFLWLCQSAEAQDFYISPQGSDQANGMAAKAGPADTNGPFLTLARAQQAVRDLKKNGQLKEAITVHIEAGYYQLSRPLDFDIRDSGFAGREVSWQAENGPAIVSGGIDLQSCAAGDAGVWSCPTEGLALERIKYPDSNRKRGNIPGFELFVNDQRLQLARWPNSDWAHIKTPLAERTRFDTFEPLPTLPDDPASVQAHILAGNDWYDQYLPLLATDRQHNEITLAANTAYPLTSGRRFYLQNIQSELDAPGEWFYDKANSKILFMPPHGAAPKLMAVSALQNLINIKGAGHLAFRHLTFRYATGVGIAINNAAEVLLDGMEIANIGGRAVEAVNSSNITVANSHIHDTGEGGILIVGGDRNTLQASNNQVHNNHIHHFGRIVMMYTPAIEVAGVGARVTHNLIEQSPGAGIMIYGNDHLLEKNEIHHVCEQAYDCGAIYSGRDWTFRGNMIRYNSLHDIQGYGLKIVDANQNRAIYTAGGARGVYLDDAASSFNVTGNIFNRAGDMSIQLGGGRDNRIENNLFVTDSYAILVDNRWPAYNWMENKKRLTVVPYRGSIWRGKYPELAEPMLHENWPEGNSIRRNVIITNNAGRPAVRYQLPEYSNVLADNLVWSNSGSFGVDYDILDRLKKAGGAPWQTWINEGVEHGSLNADPCAVIDGNRVKFCAESPVYKIGYQALPEDIGLIK